MLCSCRFDGDGSPQSTGAFEPPSTTTDEAGTTGPSTAASGTTANDASTSTQDPDDGDTTAFDPTTGGEPIGCPAPLPVGWILCEDFEQIADPSAHFSRFTGSGVSLGAPGFQSPTALTMTHQPDINWSGSVQIRFGEGPPGAAVVASDQRFDEVWVRLWLRAGEGWPVNGPGDIVSVDGVSTNPAGATTFLARVSADPFETVSFSSALSCVEGDEHVCDGEMDWSDLDPRGFRAGSAELFATDAVEDWHCMVIHARLNDPGASNGVLETVVDGELDTWMTDIDYRGGRSEFAFNRVSLEAYISQPQAQPMRRYIDDVVVATVPIDCD